MKYGLTLDEAPEGQVVTTADLKSHLRLNTDIEAGNLDRYLAVATELCERYTGRQFLTAKWNATFDAFPSSIPLPPCQEVNSVKYLDLDDQEQELEAYRVDLTVEPARLFIADKPPLSSLKPNVTINFTAGYGDGDACPPMIQHAIRLLAAHYYLIREGIVPTLGTLEQIPYGIQAILTNWKVWNA